MLAKVEKIEKLNDEKKSQLRDVIGKFSTAKLLVVGDVILDEYLLGKPERVSREAPVLVLNYVKSDYSLGGAANAAQNITSYDAACTMVGLAGEDQGKFELEVLAKKKNINLSLLSDAQRGTTVKTRIVSSSNKDQANGTIFQQQVLRVDRQNRDLIDAKQEEEILSNVKSLISDVDLILLSDYESGVFTDRVIAQILELAKKENKKILVDSSGDFQRFSGAFILTPNQPDVEKALGYKISTDEDLHKAGLEMLELTGSPNVLITRGAKGMALFSKTADEVEMKLIPAFNLSEVFDVTGAGDTVSATMALALAVNSEPIDAAILGNLGASITVRKYGTATVSKSELLELISSI